MGNLVNQKGGRKMRRISERKGFIGLTCIIAFMVFLPFAGGARAQQGGGMMMGPCGMSGMGYGMMPMMGGPGHYGKHPSSMGLMRMLHHWGQHLISQSDQLGLSEEQLDEIESILTSHIKYATRKKADLKVLFFEIQELLVKEKMNLKAVEKKIKAMEALNTDMAMEGVQTLEKALAVLAPEQQKKMRTLFKKASFMRTMRMGMMPGGMMMRGGMMGPGMMQGMMGQGGMMGPGMMQGMMGQGGTPREAKTEPTHEH